MPSLLLNGELFDLVANVLQHANGRSVLLDQHVQLGDKSGIKLG